MSDEFVPHPVVWTGPKVSRVWEHISRRDADPRRYFSAALAGSVLRFALRQGARLDGRVLDFGCGPGFLLERLAAMGGTCEGLEFSERSAIAARSRLAGLSSFRGVKTVNGLPSPFETAAFDAVFFVETLEHLLDEDLEATLAELLRLLKPGGAVVVTTPNAEDLEAAQVLCPDCGCLFHGMQHVRRFTADTLRSLMEHRGFSTRHCAPLFFDRGTIPSRLYGLALRVAGMSLPHLAYFGTTRL